jgi:hypothetical protein
LVVALEEHTPMDEAEEFARKTVDILNWYTNELNAITMAAKNRAQIPNLKDVYKEISDAAEDCAQTIDHYEEGEPLPEAVRHALARVLGPVFS